MEFALRAEARNVGVSVPGAALVCQVAGLLGTWAMSDLAERRSSPEPVSCVVLRAQPCRWAEWSSERRCPQNGVAAAFRPPPSLPLQRACNAVPPGTFAPLFSLPAMSHCPRTPVLAAFGV